MSFERPAPTLDQTLQRARRDSVEFPYLLANHAPMVLIALDRLGASRERIAEWHRVYRDANGLVAPPPPVAPIAPESWDAALGERARESDYRAFFAAETRRLGIAGAIRRYLPRLIQGMAGSALHPLMRLAYAAVKNDGEEAGVALGYWAACYLPLPAPGGRAPDTDDPAEVLAGVAEIEGVRTYVTETDLLWRNIQAVAALPGFRPVVDRLAFGPDTPRRMAATALAIFAATMELRRCTRSRVCIGSASLRRVSTTRSRFIAHSGRRSPRSSPRSASPRRRAPTISRKYVTSLRRRGQKFARRRSSSNDEHDISLTFSAWQEEAVGVIGYTASSPRVVSDSPAERVCMGQPTPVIARRERRSDLGFRGHDTKSPIAITAIDMAFPKFR